MFVFGVRGFGSCVLYEGAARWEVKLFTDDCVMISFHVPYIIMGSFLIQGVM